MDQKVTGADVTLAAFQLAEEQACERYLEARKSMVSLAARMVSLKQLATEQPKRVDYRNARDEAVSAYEAAVQRTRLAWVSWQRAQLRYDSAWTTTKGRNPRVLAMSGRAA